MPRYGSAIVLAALASLPACTTSGSASAPGAGGTAGTTHGSGAAGGATATGGSAGTTHGSGGASGGVTAAGGSAGTTRGSGGASGGAGPASGGSAGSAGASGGARPASGGASTTGGASGTAGMTHGGSTGGADTTGGSGGNAGDPGATGGTGGAPVDTSRCDDPGLTWRSANKTNYTSYPDPGSEECVKYNGCMWAGQFAACNDQKPEAWVAAHDIVAAFPDFGALELHDLCLRKGTKRLVVTVLDTCGDSDCGGCCTENQGSADELIDVESYTNARWGVPDGAIEWADLGPTSGGGCD